MATVSSHPGVGAQLREWRQRRRRTQLELALDAGISARHLSFVETGRSRPGRELLLRIVDELDVPFRERNRLLLAAGHAPAFPERAFDDPALAPVRDAIDRILAAHEPYPAVVFDRSWNLVAYNSGVLPLVEGVDPALLEPPVNVLRVALAMAPQIVNRDRVLAFFRERVERQVAATGNEGLAAFVEALDAYRAPEPGSEPDRGGEILGPVTMRSPDGRELSFFGMFAIFDTPFEVTTSELAIELLFPADQATAEAVRRNEGGSR
jgi:transcriptional regulator with XRE-family HTH domain